MSFISWQYAALLLTMLLFCGSPWVRRKGWAPALCLAGSAWFYSFAGSLAFLLFALSIGINYGLARILSRPGISARRVWLALGLAFNLGYLYAFKYAGLIHDSWGSLALHLGWIKAMPPELEVLLPIGISFYTFECISFLVDCFQRKYACPRLRDFALFVGFFPHLVAGPILRGKDLFPQLSRMEAGLTHPDYARARDFLILGFFKKLVLADPLALYCDSVFARPQDYSALTTCLGAYAFALQIYLDFSAYTDIAEGSASLLGLHLAPNFRSPYSATSLSDFWRRWHVSLSSWLRDYLYIPLGGSRQGAWRSGAAVLVTMVLGGLWHGANWTFALWGLYHGLLLAAERVLGKRGEPAPGWGWLRRALVFHAVLLGWILFRSDGLAEFMAYLRNMAGGLGSWQAQDLGIALALLATAAFVRWEGARNEDVWGGKERPLPLPAMAVMAAACVVFGAGQADLAQPFIYFRF